MAVFPQRGYLASQIARIEGTALNPGKAQCEEITFVFGGGTRLTTLLELRAVPSFLANCRTWKFSADVVWDDFIRIPFVLPSILANCPQFRQSDEAPKNGQFWRPKKWMWGLEKKAFPRIHMKIHFLQKTGSKLVKFCLRGPICILHPAIGGRHPVPCLSTQITERQGTAMYYIRIALLMRAEWKTLWCRCIDLFTAVKA